VFTLRTRRTASCSIGPDRFCQRTLTSVFWKNGTVAFCAALDNYGEPLLNKSFKEFAPASKKYLLFTMTSTNLSMPLSDPERIVMSGLDLAILSIDGTTQDIYEKYRRKGDLGFVFENVKKLVAPRRNWDRSRRIWSGSF
jgi:hypothetical protein